MKGEKGRHSRKFRSQTSDFWKDATRSIRRARKQLKEAQNKEDQRREVREKQIQAHEMLGMSRNESVFSQGLVAVERLQQRGCIAGKGQRIYHKATLLDSTRIPGISKSEINTQNCCDAHHGSRATA